MTPVTIDVPHKLGRERARERIRVRIGDLAGHIPGGMADVRSAWTGTDELTLDISAMGQQINARLEIMDAAVRVHLVLPPMLAFFSGMISSVVQAGGTKMLEDRRD